ncbi:MAG: UDPGP type 1 family protein [bacterium]
MIEIQNPQDRSVVDRVYKEGQGHVFRWWDELNASSRKKLIDQLKAVDFKLLQELRAKCVGPSVIDEFRGALEPVEFVPIPRTEKERKRAESARRLGEKMIREGKIAAFLVAGGQGTRLGFNGPKGMFPIGPVTQKSLFQMHAEKILAASRFYDVTIPWYIMTSETNDVKTRTFFQQHDFFGLKEKDVFFFTQRMIPALDEEGKFILDEKDHVFTSPNGHGGSLLALVESGAVDDMRRRGVEVFSYFQVDNVLIKIVDPVFIGYHQQACAEMSSKMLRKRDFAEKLGVFGRVNGKLKVVEYSDLSDEDMTATNPDGSLKYEAGSIAIHLLNIRFVEQEVCEGFKLPYHVAHKKIPYLNEGGEQVMPEQPNGYKFETFVFDALENTTHSVVMEIDRREEFSPVKNGEGEDSPETAVRDLTNFFGRWLEAAGATAPKKSNGDVDGFVEISPLYAMNLDMFIKRAPKDLSFETALYVGPK